MMRIKTPKSAWRFPACASVGRGARLITPIELNPDGKVRYGGQHEIDRRIFECNETIDHASIGQNSSGADKNLDLAPYASS